MPTVEERIREKGLWIPGPLKLPPGNKLSFDWVRIRGDHAYVSGHAPLNPDGTLAYPAGGKVGADLSVEEGYTAARLAGLSILGSLKRELQDLDRISAWLTVSGLVNVAPGFTETTAVINGFSDLVLELYGQDVGRHARTAIGAAMLPLNSPVIISAEVEVRR
jgi:enamine deaminase RidA (YjgF/YER057c/UK114 family)